MIINDMTHGFTVNRIRPVSELSAQLIEMTHDKTGLQLAWLKRDEENKTFGIAFKTLPFDDTGVFHILEHSVLGGSEKYKVKEPFVELLKSSMNTFLNAMTFPDKTLYPVSSRNDKDFINLVRVYLDAVFSPLIYSKPEIFYQEGWHYEVDEAGEVSYKGVVFNEMKGAMSGVEDLEEAALNKALFPDSPYRYNSGGDPASIPDLSYENFIECHKKFYSPSNGRIFLDGNMDIDIILKIIDEEYLGKSERGEYISGPEMQLPVDGGVQEISYELGQEEDEKGRTRMSWGRVFAGFDEREKTVAMHILSDVLCGSNQSPLCKAVLSQGLAEAVSMGVYDGTAQSWVKIEAVNINDDNREEVEKLIFSQLEKIADEGIDPKQIEASMAGLEYSARERDYGSTPQGLVFGMQMLDNWLYGGDPIEKLEIGDLFVNLRGKMKEGYFEKLIREVILDNPHRAKVIMVPSKTIGEERRRREEERITAETSKWTEKMREKIIQSQEALIEWQNSVDSEEALASLPHLQPEDIDPVPETLPTEEGEYKNIKTLYHDINCSGITNFSMFFDADDLEEEEISLLSFLTDILGKMKTRQHSEEELDNEIRLIFGGLSFYVSSHMVRDNRDECRIKLGVSFGTLEENVDKAIPLVVEILTQTLLDGETTALDILKQLKTKYFRSIVMSGSSMGISRISAQNSAVGVSNECAGGYRYYRWLEKNEGNWNWAELSEKLSGLINRIVCSNRLTLTLTGGTRELLSSVAAQLYASLPERGPRTQLKSVLRPWKPKKEGIAVPTDISFACAGGVLEGFDGFNGRMRIASKIITFAYLWNMVRVQGGAYGTGFSIRQDGITTSHSYRDPSAAKSLQTYKGTADFLEKFAAENDDISGFIIGAISDVLPLTTPRTRGMKADAHYFAQVTYEYREKLLKEMLETKPSDLMELADNIRKTYENSGICVIGSREQLESCSLDVIETL
ncbi:MAG: insulinase family protein [Eubacteriaceae bacterium]|nr:insulinase family protein [Eubacteriaceae bacterium]